MRGGHALDFVPVTTGHARERPLRAGRTHHDCDGDPDGDGDAAGQGLTGEVTANWRAPSRKPTTAIAHAPLSVRRIDADGKGRGATATSYDGSSDNEATADFNADVAARRDTFPGPGNCTFAAVTTTETVDDKTRLAAC